MHYSHNRSIKNDKKSESENKMRRVATIGFCIFGVGLLGFGISFLFYIISSPSDGGVSSAIPFFAAIIATSSGLILSLSAYICHLLNKLLLKTTKKILNIYIFAPIISIILFFLFIKLCISINILKLLGVLILGAIQQ